MLIYIICKIFGIVRVKHFLIIKGLNSPIEVRIKTIPDSFIIRNELYSHQNVFNVVKTTSEIINETLIYNWINVENMCGDDDFYQNKTTNNDK